MKILLIQEPDGSFEVVTDGPAEVICVSEFTPNDRLYRLTDTHTVSAERVAEILGNDPIGSSADDRHQACAGRIVGALEAKPHLKLVE